MEGDSGRKLHHISGRLQLNGLMESLITPILQRFSKVSELELWSTATSVGSFTSNPFYHLAGHLTYLSLRELHWQAEAIINIIQTPMPSLQKLCFQFVNLPHQWMAHLAAADMPRLEVIMLEISSYSLKTVITPRRIEDLAFSGKFPKLRTIDIESDERAEFEGWEELDGHGDVEPFLEELLVVKEKLEQKDIVLAYRVREEDIRIPR